MKIRKSLTTIGKKAASAANYVSTTPLTQSPQAKTSKNIWSDAKNAVMGFFGKGAPLHGRASEIKNLVWDRERGNLFNGSYESTGELVLTLRDGVLNERTLQLLSALDDSETGELDPSSKGLQGGITNPGNALAHKQAKRQCDKLLELRKNLEKCGGSLRVENTSDGFGRMLKISINTRNKSAEEVKKEILMVFGALGIGSPDLAESLAKELVYDRDMKELNHSSEMSHAMRTQKSDSDTQKQEEKQVSEDTVCGGKQEKGSAAAGIDPQMFSLSGDSGISHATFPASGADHQAAQQAQFLESEEARITGRENSVGNAQSSTIDGPSINNAEEFRTAVEGLGGITCDDQHGNLSTSADTPLVTPATQQASRGNGGSQTRGGVR